MKTNYKIIYLLVFVIAFTCCKIHSPEEKYLIENLGDFPFELVPSWNPYTAAQEIYFTNDTHDTLKLIVESTYKGFIPYRPSYNATFCMCDGSAMSEYGSSGFTLYEQNQESNHIDFTYHCHRDIYSIEFILLYNYNNGYHGYDRYSIDYSNQVNKHDFNAIFPLMSDTLNFSFSNNSYAIIVAGKGLIEFHDERNNTIWKLVEETGTIENNVP